MGVERPNVVLYTLGGPRGSSGLSQSSFRIFTPISSSSPTPVPPLSPFPSPFLPLLLFRPPSPRPPILCRESLRLGFLVPPLPSVVSLSNRPRQKTCQPLPPPPPPLPLSLSLHGGVVDEGRRRGGGRVIFFRGHRGGGETTMIFATTISLGKSIALRPRRSKPSNDSSPHRFIATCATRSFSNSVLGWFRGWVGKNDRRIFEFPSTGEEGMGAGVEGEGVGSNRGWMESRSFR